MRLETRRAWFPAAWLTAIGLVACGGGLRAENDRPEDPSSPSPSADDARAPLPEEAPDVDAAPSDTGVVTEEELGPLGFDALLKADPVGRGDELGSSIAISADGSLLVVGARSESGSATTVNGAHDDAAAQSGAAYVFRRSPEGWRQEAYLKASNAEANDWFGFRVAISGDGSLVAVSALQESSGGEQDASDNRAPRSGAVYVFAHDAVGWSQQAYLKAARPRANDYFGEALALSADGSTLAVGAVKESSAAVGVDGDDADDSAEWSGAAYVFRRAGQRWSQEAYVKASNTDAGDSFGWSVSLSADGDTLAVGAPGESSLPRGRNSVPSNNAASAAGAVYVFARKADAWAQTELVKAESGVGGERFGNAVSLSATGEVLAVGAFGEGAMQGATYVFKHSGEWQQRARLVSPFALDMPLFGWSVSLSADARTLAVGAMYEDSLDAPTDDAAPQSGAAYVYRR